MKSLELHQLDVIQGGKSNLICDVGGFSMALGVMALGAAIATGGIGFMVAAGIGAYFGTGAGLLCSIAG